MIRSLFHRYAPAVACCGVLLGAGASASHAAPSFNPAKFSRAQSITNQYFPLTPGTTFFFEGTFDGKSSNSHFYVSHQTRVILGIPCVVVRDSVWVEGAIEETTADWFAQDDDMNVWYMGEYSTVYPSLSHDGSFQAGVLGAQAGIVMEGDPKVGDIYRQEYFAGHAEDSAKILSLTESICVPYGCYTGNVLLTNEQTPIDPGITEAKHYAVGIGNVKSMDITGSTDESHLVAITHD